MTAHQTNQFVPLISAAPSADKREFQVTVIPQKDQSQLFQPQLFQSSAKAKTPAGERSLHNTNCEPHLSVQRDGGRITNIRVECNCGQTIELACVYEEPTKPSENAKTQAAN